MDNKANARINSKISVLIIILLIGICIGGALTYQLLSKKTNQSTVNNNEIGDIKNNLLAIQSDTSEIIKKLQQHDKNNNQTNVTANHSESSPAIADLQLLLNSIIAAKNDNNQLFNHADNNIDTIRYVLDDLLLFFSKHNLNGRDVDNLKQLLQPIISNDERDRLSILSSSYQTFSEHATSMPLLSEPIVSSIETETDQQSRWKSFLDNFITIKKSQDLENAIIDATPESVTEYNDALDLWQNQILPAVQNGDLFHAKLAMEALNPNVLFSNQDKWKEWKSNFDKWSECYKVIINLRVEITKRLINKITPNNDINSHVSTQPQSQ